MLTVVQEIEFNQVRLALQEFLLFGQIEVASWCPSSFVARAEDFDHSHYVAIVSY